MLKTTFYLQLNQILRIRQINNQTNIHFNQNQRNKSTSIQKQYIKSLKSGHNLSITLKQDALQKFLRGRRATC